MPHAYTAAYLSAADVDRAYALIAALAPDLTAEEWRAFCRTGTVAGAPPGDRIIVATDPLGYVRGICVCAPAGDAGGRALEVPLFAPLSAADAPGVADALLDGLRRIARRDACATIHFRPLGAEDRTGYLRGEVYGDAPGVVMLVGPDARQAQPGRPANT